MGGGGSEAYIILSFLGFPNGPSYKAKTFHQLEEKLGNIICDHASQEMEVTLKEEICHQLEKEDRPDGYGKWLQKEDIKQVCVTVAFDMGWNK
mmetsp:Transcript_27584/g.40755  ORF Transcript_27584/g.40755 Transcript_27584/m.40755 type:complete len:93 (-) Transcript_27584:980-1258(-)